MNLKKSLLRYSSYQQSSNKLPTLNKTGFIQRLQIQRTKKSKRQQDDKNVKERLSHSHHSFNKKQNDYYGEKTKEFEEKIQLSKTQNEKKYIEFKKQNEELIKRAKQNRDNVLKREAKARKQLFQKQTKKLQKSILLRSTFSSNRSSKSLSKSSRNRSLQNSMISVDPNETLNQINEKLTKARKTRQQNLTTITRSKTKLDQHRKQALQQSNNNKQAFANKSLHSFMKTFDDLKNRMKLIQKQRDAEISQKIKRQKQKKQLVKHKTSKFEQQNNSRLKKQNQNLQKKLQNAFQNRFKTSQQRNNNLITKNKQYLQKAHKKYQSQELNKFRLGESILKKYNDDYKVFKTFKSQMQRQSSYQNGRGKYL